MIKKSVQIGIPFYLLLFLFIGCSQPPSEKDGSTVAKNLIHQKNSDQYIKLISFHKTNGVESEKSGQKIYNLEYEAEVEVISECYYSGSVWDRYLAYPLNDKFLTKNLERSPVGHKEIFSDEFRFEKTDKGWRGEDGKIY